jgi:hypothetical protein
MGHGSRGFAPHFTEPSQIGCWPFTNLCCKGANPIDRMRERNEPEPSARSMPTGEEIP